MNFKRVILYITTIAICIALSACSNNLSNRQLRKILKDNGYNYESAKVETILDLNNDVNGLDNSNQNKLVLINNNGYYGLAVINTETNKVTIPSFGYTPLNVVQQEIWNMGKDINIKDAAILKKYIEQYGINGLEEKEYAEKYLREITGKDGIISTQTAQSIISNSTMNMFPNISSNDEVTVLFEDDSAVPVYYTTQSNIMAYNWNGIFPENVYNIWKASTDSRTQQTMVALYGQPYVPKTVWAVVDSDLNEVGTYDSLEEVKTKLLSKNTKETNNASSAPKTTPKETENNSNANESNITNGILIMYTNAELEPFEYYENGKIVGIDIDIAECIAKQLNMGIKIESVDFDALIPSLSSKKCDMVLSSMSKTDEREKFVDFSTPYYDDFCIALNKDNTELNKKILEVYEKMKADGSIDNILNKYK